MRRQQARAGVVVALLAVALPAAAQVIPRSAALRIAHLLGDTGNDKVLPGGYTFSDVQVERSRAAFILTRKADGHEVGRILLLPPSQAKAGDHHSKSFALRVVADDPDPKVAAALAAGVASVVADDTGDIFVSGAETPAVHAGEGTAAGPAEGGSGEGRSTGDRVAALTPGTRRALWLGQMVLAVGLLLGVGLVAVRRPRRKDAGAPPSSP